MEDQELGLYTLNVVVKGAAKECMPFLESFLPTFEKALQDPSTGSAYYVGIILKNTIFSLSLEASVI